MIELAVAVVLALLLCGLFSKLWALFGYRLYYGTQYLGVPKWDPDFGNYPCSAKPSDDEHLYYVLTEGKDRRKNARLMTW